MIHLNNKRVKGILWPERFHMTKAWEQLNKRVAEYLRKRTPGQIVVVLFALLVLVGALFLTLPIAARDGNSHGFLTALFTATSATCVTGLVTGDTWTMWSGFGQAVILLLIQIGGLGFMSIFSIFLFTLKRQFGIKNRMMLSQNFGVDSLESVVVLMRHALLGTLLIEGAGALILAVRFSFDFGVLQGIKLGVWHSISAFCNAGFDILGFLMPGGSVIPYGTDVVVMVTLMLLIVLGGLGFFVWNDLFDFPKTKKLSIYSKLVLLISGILIVCGAALVALFEWDNPATIGNLPVGQKILACFFQSVTARTAGFDGMGQGGLTEAGKGITSFLMLIGGSSGSTAGGLKTVTFAVIVLSVVANSRGSRNVTVFRRTVQKKQLQAAYTLGAMMLALTFAGALVISATGGFSLSDSLYEAASAIATVGLTTGITPNLSIAAKLLLIVYMFFGRVGVMTISLGFLFRRKSDELYTYAETSLIIG